MSDTPRTDDFSSKLRGLGVGYYDALSFARQLEKELNATTAELERTREQLRVAREALIDVAKRLSPWDSGDWKNLPFRDGHDIHNALTLVKDALNHLAQSNPDKEEPNVPLE